MAPKLGRRKLISFLLLIFLFLPLTGSVFAGSISKTNIKTALQRVVSLTRGESKAPSHKKDLQNYVEGEVLVRFKKSEINLQSSTGRTRASHFARSKGLKGKENIKMVNVSVFEIGDNKTIEQKIEELEKDPRVEYAQPNYQYYPALIPNDTNFSSLWGLNNTGQVVNGTSGSNDADIDAPEAWDMESSSWTDTIVAVIDTGVTLSHPDLAGNLVSGWDFVDGDDTPEDDNGHGTHIAGIIAGVVNNNLGISGLSYQNNLKVLPLKTDLTSAQNIAAIEYVASRGVKVINASWGCYGSDQGGTHPVCGGDYTFNDQAMIEAIEAFPGLFITAAGNGDGDTDSEGDDHDGGQTLHSYPCDHDSENIICIAATDQDDNLTSWSDYGATSVDVAAPGENVYSTYNQYTADPLFVDPLFLEDFEDTVPPDIGNQFVKEGLDNNWATLDVGGKSIWSDYSYPYAPDADTSIVSSPIDLTGKSAATLSFSAACDTEAASPYWYDYVELYVRRTSSSSWVSLMKFDEDRLYDGFVDPFWYGNISVAITPYISSETEIKFRWVTDSFDIGGPYIGCMIDDIKVEASVKYAYLDGTSMATPYVAGLAGLLWSYNPNLTPAEVKNTILSTGDTKPSLAGKTVSGKRINAYSALKSLDTTPPTGSIKINTNATQAYSKSVTLSLSASDTGFGVSKMRFSNDGTKWTGWTGYKSSYSWNLTNTSYGGNSYEGTKTVYVQFKDGAGNISTTKSDWIIYNPRKVKAITVYKFHYNARGDDRYNLNDEYVVLKNNLRGSIIMSKWFIKDAQGHKYIFPTFKLKAGASATIHTGKGTNTGSHLYMKRAAPIWNNDHDTLKLYTSDSKLILTRSY